MGAAEIITYLRYLAVEAMVSIVQPRSKIFPQFCSTTGMCWSFTPANWIMWLVEITVCSGKGYVDRITIVPLGRDSPRLTEHLAFTPGTSKARDRFINQIR